MRRFWPHRSVISKRFRNPLIPPSGHKNTQRQVTTKEVQKIQEKIGAVPDGWWGPRSMEACQKHLRSLMPNPPEFPHPGMSSMLAFYGQPGQVPLTKVPVPFSMQLYDGDTPVSSISVHDRCAESLSKILIDLAVEYPDHASRKAAGITKFFGSYVNRKQRGGTAPSKHAWGVAIDLDANRNGLHTPWPTKSSMPFQIMEIFARHGWVNLGWIIWRDAMHFQATR
jgi:hypothetical protein